MKRILLFVFIIAGSFVVKGQELTWNTNLDKAMEISKSTNKPIMLFFTGSDWCGWCKRLQNEVFFKPEFEAWAKSHVVLVELDFPRSHPLAQDLQVQNSQLQQFFEVQGYPTIWFVNASKVEGKTSFEKLGNTGYVAGGPTAWLDGANRILKTK
ncbi:hypothetical protein BH11BAC1_BH11BAC1_11370 [soil metagenome]